MDPTADTAHRPARRPQPTPSPTPSRNAHREASRCAMPCPATPLQTQGKPTLQRTLPVVTSHGGA